MHSQPAKSIKSNSSTVTSARGFMRFPILLGLLSGVLSAEPSNIKITPEIQEILGFYCTDCHEDGTEKGKFRLDNLEELTIDTLLDVMNKMHERVHFEEMPPEDKDQPTEEERTQLADWLASVLSQNNALKLPEKLRTPAYGNKVSHKKLFSGKYKDLAGFTPDRHWLINEFIFDDKFNRILESNGQRDIDGQRQNVLGDTGRNGVRVNLTNPFLLPSKSGVRYYDTTTLNGGHLQTMITNAKEMARFLIERSKQRNTIPALKTIMDKEWQDQKILADREAYLKSEIEPLLRELYKGKHESLLPKFDASKFLSLASAEKTAGNQAKPSREIQAEIFSTMQKFLPIAKDDKDLIFICSKSWAHFGVSERDIILRANFIRNRMESVKKDMENHRSSTPNTPDDAEMEIIRNALLKHRKPGDDYGTIIAKCVAEWSDGFKREREKAGISDEVIGELVDQLFNKIIERSPDSQEYAEYSALMRSYLEKSGTEGAIVKLIQTVFLRTDFVYRHEHGEGEADDEHGRRMMSPRDASYALAYALTDSSPDKELQEAAKTGKLNTREDYRREVERMLKDRSKYYIIDERVERAKNDSFTNMPIRELRFFREFFGYPEAIAIFKDRKRFGGEWDRTVGRVVSEADMLVEHILEEDQDVFEKLLTTEEFYVFHSGNNEDMAEGSAYVRKIYDYFKDMDWKNFKGEDLKKHVDFIKENDVRGVNSNVLAQDGGSNSQVGPFKSTMNSYHTLLGNGQTHAAPFSQTLGFGKTEGQTRSGKQLLGAEVAKTFNIDLKDWDYPITQPTKIENRKGILTHPAWLVAFSKNTETDPIHRGKWVREKLLAGTVPDVPITVDAVAPEDPHKTLRGRIEKVTEAEYCWGCHERMNPVGLPFEMYDDFGRYRMEEFLEYPENLIKTLPDKGSPEDDLRDIYKTLPIISKGYLEGTGNPKLDGEVTDALDMIERLGKSTKVRQSIIRHAFRYFMGRNEFLSDSKTLIEADQAYVESGGSFDAVIISLLTSDSFIYRKPATN